jgi:hypothetical protein
MIQEGSSCCWTRTSWRSLRASQSRRLAVANIGRTVDHFRVETERVRRGERTLASIAVPPGGGRLSASTREGPAGRWLPRHSGKSRKRPRAIYPPGRGSGAGSRLLSRATRGRARRRSDTNGTARSPGAAAVDRGLDFAPVHGSRQGWVPGFADGTRRDGTRSGATVLVRPAAGMRTASRVLGNLPVRAGVLGPIQNGQRRPADDHRGRCRIGIVPI